MHFDFESQIESRLTLVVPPLATQAEDGQLSIYTSLDLGESPAELASLLSPWRPPVESSGKIKAFLERV